MSKYTKKEMIANLKEDNANTELEIVKDTAILAAIKNLSSAETKSVVGAFGYTTRNWNHREEGKNTYGKKGFIGWVKGKLHAHNFRIEQNNAEIARLERR